MTRRNGFVYNDKTSEAFQEQKHVGAVFPSMAIVEMIGRIAEKEYRAELDLLKSQYAADSSYVGDNIMPEDLIAIIKRKLRLTDPSDTSLRNRLLRALAKAQRAWFKSLFENKDADPRYKLRVSYGLDRDKVFVDKLEDVQRIYVDRAIEKIGAGKSTIRQNFIEEFSKYISGQGNMETVNDLLEKAKAEVGTFSRFFARDQMQRFDKSMTDASMIQAGARKFKVLPVRDGRTRDTHRALRGKIFFVDNPPKELDDYNCRCRKVPIFDDLEDAV